MSGYVESAADAAFTMFLASLTPSKVLRELEPRSTVERKHLRFVRRRIELEQRKPAPAEFTFTPAQLRVAAEWAARQERVA